VSDTAGKRGVMSTTTVVIVRQGRGPTCTVCEKALKRDCLYVRTAVSSKVGRRPLQFSVGRFCTVRCLMMFAEEKKRKRLGTIYGWTFGRRRGEVLFAREESP
jgi:predicted nucleic acid-binding Zn ribbon protein